MVKHYREGKAAESFGGVRVKSISERHHQKIESLVSMITLATCRVERSRTWFILLHCKLYDSGLYLCIIYQVNCHQSKMSVKIAIGVEGGGGANSKSLFKRGHSVKTPGKKKLPTSAKYLDDDKDNYSSSESSYSSYSDQDSPPQKRSKKAHQKKPNRFIKNVTKKKSDSNRKQDKKLEKEEDEEYVVESIVDMRKDKDGTRYFFVKWENYDR